MGKSIGKGKLAFRGSEGIAADQVGEGGEGIEPWVFSKLKKKRRGGGGSPVREAKELVNRNNGREDREQASGRSRGGGRSTLQVIIKKELAGRGR